MLRPTRPSTSRWWCFWKASTASSVLGLLGPRAEAAVDAQPGRPDPAAVEELPAGTPGSAELIAWRPQLRRTTGIEFLGLADLRDAVRRCEPFPDPPAYALPMALQAQAELWHGHVDGPKHARAAVPTVHPGR